ncbi:MAG: twin-arginine translocation pathway signal, partial [Planctomycetaceae bacterium]|nr:twin-arginine translocation pathway signal [Planctomycetaceae bacterium]
MSDLNRRNFLHGVGAIGTGIAVSGASSAEAQSDQENTLAADPWSDVPERVWIGPEYWANPLQDWKIHPELGIECLNAAANRNLHWITRSLGKKSGSFEMSVVIGRPNNGNLGKGKGSAGFRIGIRGPLEDYRNAVVFGNGLDIGFNVKDGLFIGRVKSQKPVGEVFDRQWIRLDLKGEPVGEKYRLTLSAYSLEDGKLLDQIQNNGVPADQLHGNIALVNNHAGGGRRGNQPNYGAGRFRFARWTASGEKIEVHPERAFGPILFSQYTLSSGILKLSAQMPPIGKEDSQTVQLQIDQGQNNWKTIGEETIHPEARTATFRIPDWNDKKDTPYRLVYTQKHRSGDEAKERPFSWAGTIRKDPVDQEVVTVADVSCNIHQAFPNAHYVANMGKLDPDLIAFVGDQFYESTGGYGVQRAPLDKAILDYLRKWWIHGWTWRELMRDRPSISIPDDHDAYQGNIWGEGGAGKQRTQEAGGYGMPATWVNVVHRTQTSHHPDPFDPTPIKQNISVYYGPMTYG